MRRDKVKRSGGRKGRGQRTVSSPASPFVVRGVRPYEILNEDSLSAIEATADRILEKIGLDVRNDPLSLEAFAKAGAKVEQERVRFEPGWCRDIIQQSAPPIFTQHARNPEKSVRIGGDNVVFAPAYGPPFVRAQNIDRRYARYEDFKSVVKLVYLSPHMHHSGGTVCEPVDLPVETRHLDMVHAHLKLSDKPFMGSVTSGERASDSIEMTELVFGKEFLKNNCAVLGLINVNSPLVLDGTMLEALRMYAEAGQGTVITPFVIGGAGGPVTPAGMLSQALAEAMAGMALAQIIRPGAPVVFGYLSTGLNMRTGAPVRHDETWQCFLAAGQLARRLGVPFRCGSATTTSKIPDYQAGLESALNFEAALLSGAHLMIHASGNVEGGLCLDLDKLVLDCEMLGMASRFIKTMDTSPSALAFDAIEAAGPGGNFLETEHVLHRYEEAFFEAELFDDNSFEQWRDDGAASACERAHLKRLQMEASYEAPEIDSGIESELDRFVAERKSEIGHSPN